ncbi:MAG: hypothetical protein V3U80_09300 [Flavobacteriaceae bacterium]
MKNQLFKTFLPVLLILSAITFLGSGCGGDVPPPENNCSNGISYKLDGSLLSFQNSSITAEIVTDGAIGKFYDIWTDENDDFYYHSTITETGETAPFATNWFVLNDVANIITFNGEPTVNIQFTIDQGANAVGDQVTISFSGTYDDSSGVNHTITEGVICTTIDVAN